VFTRFGSAARRALRLAEQECRNHNHYYVGAEHLLLALCAEADAPTREYLARCGTSADVVGNSARRALGTGEDRTWEGIIVTPRVRRIIEIAEADAGPDAEIEPVHLLRGIVAEGRSRAAELLGSAERNIRSTPPVAG
jgi:ATP-dependent Clp protease ATP-binding subunit ClpA